MKLIATALTPMPDRIECPQCRTSYTMERLGINSIDKADGAVIVCSCCFVQFNVAVHESKRTFLGFVLSSNKSVKSTVRGG